MLHEYHVIYSFRYYPQFRVTAVGLGTYYPWIWGYACICVCIYTYIYIYTLLCVHTCNTQNLFTIIIHYRADSQSEHLNIFLLFLRPAVGLSASCEATLLM